MTYDKHSPRIVRGIVGVSAEAETPNIKALVEEMNTAFADFKVSHQKQVDELRAGLDDHAIKLAAREMYGDPGDEAGKSDSFGLHTRAEIRKYYERRASERNEATGATLSDMFRVVAGLKPINNAIMASLSEGTDSAGGYAVPSRVMPQILDAMAASSALLQSGAGVVPLPVGAKSVTAAALDTLPAAAWRKELGAIVESQPTLRGVTATPKSLACIVRVSRELLADAPDVDRALRHALAQSFALELDRVGLVGSGTDPEPRGIANTTGVHTVSQGANGTALADYSPIVAGVKAILEANGPMPTAAIMAPRTLVDFGSLADTLGQPLNAPRLISGVAQHQTTQVAIDDTAGTNSDASRIFVGDFTSCYYLMREALSVQLLREAYAKTGELGFLCHVRGDFVIPYPQALAVVEGVRPKA